MKTNGWSTILERPVVNDACRITTQCLMNSKFRKMETASVNTATGNGTT